MKKIVHVIGYCLGVVLAILILLVMILLLPFDYLKYRRSLYYKIEGKKYTFFAASSAAFALYNEITKAGLPIRYVSNPFNAAPECGLFIFDGILMLPDENCFFYRDGWFHSTDSNEIALEEYLETQILEANALVGQTIFQDAVVLIDGNAIDDLESARQEKRFLVFQDDLTAVLKKFCETRTIE